MSQPDPTGDAAAETTASPSDEPARPDEPAKPAKSAAEQLFERGLKEMLAGNFAQGCPALAQSYRLDPLPGALFTLAECERKWGKLAAALTHYRDFVTRVARMDSTRRERQEERVEVANTQLAELDRRVPRVTLRLPQDVPEGTEVELDGNVMVATTFGVAMPVDPGEHRLVVRAPGRQPHERVVQLAEGDNEELQLQVGPPDEPPPPPPPPPGLHPLQVGALIAGGIGVAGIVVGSVTGILALGEKSTIDEQCVDGACTPEGLDAVDKGQLVGTISTVGFAVGLAGIATGVVLWLVAPEEPSEQAAGWSFGVAGPGPVDRAAGASSLPSADLRIGATYTW